MVYTSFLRRVCFDVVRARHTDAQREQQTTVVDSPNTLEFAQNQNESISHRYIVAIQDVADALMRRRERQDGARSYLSRLSSGIQPDLRAL